MVRSANLGYNAGYLRCSSPVVSGRPMSWAVWARLYQNYPSTSTPAAFYFFRATSSTPGNAIAFQWDHAYLGGSLRFSATSGGGTVQASFAMSPPTLGQWAHFGVAWDSDGTARLYFNGGLVGSSSVVKSVGTLDRLDLGNGSSITANGLLSDPAEFPGVALDAADFAAMAAGVSPANFAPTRYWDDLTGTGPHSPAIGTGDLVEFFTVTDGDSDPPLLSDADFTEPWGLGVPAGTFGPYTGKPQAVRDPGLDLTEPWGVGVPAGTFGPYTGKPRVREADLDFTEPWGLGVPAGTFGPYTGKPQAVRDPGLDLTEPWGLGVPAGTFGPYTGRAVYEREGDLDFTEAWGIGIAAGTFGPFTGRTIERSADLDLTEPWGIGIAAGVFGAFSGKPQAVRDPDLDLTEPWGIGIAAGVFGAFDGKPHAVRSADLDLTEPWGIGIAAGVFGVFNGKPHAVRSADLDLTEPWGIGITAGVFGAFTGKPETKHQYRIYRRVSPTAAWTLYAIVAPDDPGVTPTVVSHVVTGAPGTDALFQVRAVSHCGVEDVEPLRQVRVAFAADGDLITPVPDAPQGLRLIRGAGGLVTAAWSYLQRAHRTRAASFHVYRAVDGAAFDFATPYATVAAGGLIFSRSLGTLSHGTHVRCIVRAVAADGAEEQNHAIVEAVADAQAPAVPTIHLAEVVS